MARNVRRAAMRAQKDARPLEHGHQDLDRDLEPDDVARVVQEAPCARARRVSAAGARPAPARALVHVEQQVVDEEPFDEPVVEVEQDLQRQRRELREWGFGRNNAHARNARSASAGPAGSAAWFRARWPAAGRAQTVPPHFQGERAGRLVRTLDTQPLTRIQASASTQTFWRRERETFYSY